MPQNAYNIGSDTKVTIVSNGVIIGASILTSFKFRQSVTKLASKGLDGVNRYRDLEEGWEGDLTFDRADSVWDDYFALKEANRYAGLQPPEIRISETTVNAGDGTISKYRFDGVSVSLDEGGDRSGDAKVEQRIGWRASRRIKVQ